MGRHAHAKAGGGSTTHTHDVTGDKHGHPTDGLLPVAAPGKPFSEGRHPAVVRMVMPERIDFAEGKPFVAVRAGDWTWTDYGRVQVTHDDLDLIKRSFDEDALRRKLPVINEDHDPSRRIGTIAAVEWFGEDALKVTPDYNPVGAELVKNDQYGYPSPELVFDYRDAETGAQHPAVLSGLALTNKPRMKSLGGIACSDNGVRASVMAFSEGTVTGSTPSAAAVALMAEMDDSQLSEDDGDPMPPCSYAPPFSEPGRCPGYTKVLCDGDGDAPGDLPGCCALAEMCNGYSPVITGGGMSPVPLTQPFLYSEGARMPTENEGTTPPVEPVPTPTPEPTPVPDTPAPVVAANMSEVAADNAKLREQVARLTQRLDMSERATKLAVTQGRIDDLLRANKITPAEAKGFSEEKHLMLFSENESLLSVFDEREANAVPFGENGHGKELAVGANETEQRMASAVKEFSEMKKKEGKRATPQEAAAYALQAVSGGTR